jgi:hypothetical protein
VVLFFKYRQCLNEFERDCLSMLRPHREPDKSGPIALNQFRPSVPVWSETLWPTFVTHVGIST